jgi:hypothetical protein
MAMDQLRNGETLESISRRLLDTNFRRSSLPPRKDTITVPSDGYAAIRFRANNPGEYEDPGPKVVQRKSHVPTGPPSLYLRYLGMIYSHIQFTTFHTLKAHSIENHFNAFLSFYLGLQSSLFPSDIQNVTLC